jgi:hypothetical protein
MAVSKPRRQGEERRSPQAISAQGEGRGGRTKRSKATGQFAAKPYKGVRREKGHRDSAVLPFCPEMAVGLVSASHNRYDRAQRHV